MKLSLLLLLAPWLIPGTLQAQSTLTEKLRKQETGQGTIVLNHPAAVEHAVNSTKQTTQPRHTVSHKPVSHKDSTRKEQTAETHQTDTQAQTDPRNGKSYVARARHKARGYRICIFTGGNSRADKTKAIQMGNKCREKFPELAAYTSFQAPRWVTHVGDFRNQQEAQKYVSLIKRARFTYEVRIIASEVNLPY